MTDERRRRPDGALEALLTARRYAVPAWMVARATERRLAGDWRGACSVAAIDVGIEAGRVARQHGRRVADQLVDDLEHLVPDLLRWHLPRRPPHGALARDQLIPLAYYGGAELALLARVPTGLAATQRVSLLFAAVPSHPSGSFHLSRELWDARRTGELLRRCGGVDRLPFFTIDGRRLRPDEYGAPERSIELLESGDVVAALTEAGFRIDLTPARYRYAPQPAAAFGVLADLPVALSTLLDTIQRGADLLGVDQVGLPAWRRSNRYPLGVTGARTDRPTISVPEPHTIPLVPRPAWLRPPDHMLLRHGWLRPDELHPLVGQALFPGAAHPSGPRAPVAPEPVLVRCQGQWHPVTMEHGAVKVTHPPNEPGREVDPEQPSGAPLGCSAASDHWRQPDRRLPRRLRQLRKDLILRAIHGDLPGVRFLLDAGIDPVTFWLDGQTLLHLLPALDDPALVAELVRAGIPVDTRDHQGCTPLGAAVLRGGSPALVRALLDAGADPFQPAVGTAGAAAVAARLGRNDLTHLLGLHRSAADGRG